MLSGPLLLSGRWPGTWWSPAPTGRRCRRRGARLSARPAFDHGTLMTVPCARAPGSTAAGSGRAPANLHSAEEYAPTTKPPQGVALRAGRVLRRGVTPRPQARPLSRLLVGRNFRQPQAAGAHRGAISASVLRTSKVRARSAFEFRPWWRSQHRTRYRLFPRRAAIGTGPGTRSAPDFALGRAGAAGRRGTSPSVAGRHHFVSLGLGAFSPAVNSGQPARPCVLAAAPAVCPNKARASPPAMWLEGRRNTILVDRGWR